MDGNVNEASVSLQAGNESLRLVATIAAYLAAIVGLCGRSPNCPRLNATYAFNRGYQKCPNSGPLDLSRGWKSFRTQQTASAVFQHRRTRNARYRAFRLWR